MPQVRFLRVLRFLSGIFLMAMLAGGAYAQPLGASETVLTDQVRATLLAYAPQGVLPAAESAAPPPVWLGLRLEHAPGWHTYWHNPGDTGMPTEMQWLLPAGVHAGEIHWPVPRIFRVGEMVNFGYAGDVLLPVPLEVAATYPPEATEILVRLHAQWLACRQECLPQEGVFALRLPLHGSTAAAADAFEAALAARPLALGSAAGTSATPSADGTRLALRIAGLPTEVHGTTLTLLPEDEGVLANAPEGLRQSWSGSVWQADVPLAPEGDAMPGTLALVLATAGEGEKANPRSWRVQVPVAGSPAGTAAKAASKQAPALPPALQAAIEADKAAHAVPATSATPAAAAATSAQVPAGAFRAALLGALLGGMILNLMPCVFPVLAIKVMGFAQHGSDARAQRAGGLAYTAGVVLSFLLLGALLLALRAAGQQLGWGFQLQSPAVVAALAALFALIGLNLSGLFEVGQFVPSSLAAVRARRPSVDAFLSGVLAVAVASPCTAPFMGASMGLAIGLPAVQALGLFATIGFGMALPYLLISFWPALAQRMPRPGAWMEVFKHFMAFPMYGTAVWLLWVLGQQTGINGAAALLALLVALALLLWALGLQGRARRWLAPLAGVLLAALLVGVGPHVLRVSAAPANAAAPAAADQGARWQPWSAAAVHAALERGQPVFVDFTASWCVTCQYNKKTTLARADVLAALDAAGVLTLRADWTRRDAVIGVELQRLGRAGVPTYALHAPGKPTLVMSEIIGADEIKKALEKL